MSHFYRIKIAFEARFLTDSAYIKKRYFEKFGSVLNLENPVKFSEKIQWLKLNKRDNTFTKLVDKYEAKKFVNQKVGDRYVIPTFKLYDSADEINLEDLPAKFALKATHGSGWNQIHLSHDNITTEQLRSYFRKWLSKSYYLYSKEWPYKNVKPRVLCEELIFNKDNSLPEDYKFFVFNGKVKLIQVDHDRFSNHTRSFYDREWKKKPFSIGYRICDYEIAQPKKFKEMILVAEKLAEDFTFLRVDLYNINGIIKVGELTFFPGNGLEQFTDPEWDLELGTMLKLDN